MHNIKTISQFVVVIITCERDVNKTRSVTRFEEGILLNKYGTLSRYSLGKVMDVRRLYDGRKFPCHPT